MVCTDGSDASIQAVETTKNGYMNEKKDFLYVAHCYSLEKNEYLTYKLKKEYIH